MRAPDALPCFLFLGKGRRLKAVTHTSTACNARTYAGTLPAALSTMTVVENIDFRDHPSLSGTIPRQFGGMWGLKEFRLTAAISGTVPPEFIAPLQRLSYLRIGGEWLRHAASAR